MEPVVLNIQLAGSEGASVIAPAAADSTAQPLPNLKGFLKPEARRNSRDVGYAQPHRPGQFKAKG